MFFPIALLLLFLVRSQAQGYPSSGCGGQSPDNPGTTISKTISYDGEQRVYIVHLPSDYSQSSATGVPVIFALPGYTISAQYMSNNFAMNTQANQYTYMAVYVQGTSFGSGSGTITWNDESCDRSPGPDGPTCIPSEVYSLPLPPGCEDADGNNCNWCNCYADDVGFIQFLLDSLESTYCIDTSREYVLGYSQGGMMTHRMGCVANDRFAAIAPFHGQLHIGFNCMPEKNNDIPICLVWGRNDRTLPGEDINGDGWLYLPVTAVAENFATHNGCVLSGGMQSVTSVSDGIRSWSCTAYLQFPNGCNAATEVRICAWNGGHVYPTQGGTNFGLSAVWEFFQRFQRLPSGEIRENPLNSTFTPPKM